MLSINFAYTFPFVSNVYFVVSTHVLPSLLVFSLKSFIFVLTVTVTSLFVHVVELYVNVIFPSALGTFPVLA